MKSTLQEIRNAHMLVKRTETEIARLVGEGRRVHIIFDFDGVLSSSLSDDVFELGGRDLENYFNYEARLFLSPPRPGIWLPLAKRVGELHASQDIVTGRSSFPAFRVMTFCMWHCGPNLSRWVRWVLYLGHQSKADSFRIILESLKADSQIFIFFIDDNPRHVETFTEISRRLEITERAVGIVSPKIREYTEEQLKWHYEAVMNVKGDEPVIIPGTPGGYIDGFMAFPNGLDGFRGLIIKNFLRSEQESAIQKFGPLLEMTFQELFPDEPITPEGLHFAFRYLQGEAAHDTMMVKEIMEEAVYSGKIGKTDGQK